MYKVASSKVKVAAVGFETTVQRPVTGDVGSLEAAAEAAIENIKEDGMLAGYTIISNPHKEVLKDLI